jgi:uncharacterized oligopeptide transporter (OPT) family protein
MSAENRSGKKSWLPTEGTWKYHLLLAGTALLVLGPLGGVTAAYMNFSLGFFIGGQVLAGILGSAVTFGYGADGKHGANYIQTMSASVAGMSGMAVIIQAMVWLDMEQPPAWQLVLYFMCIGFFGVGVGMLYTPVLVDRMKLTFPSGLAVANILRALTDKRLLRRSIGQLGAGALFGYVADMFTTLVTPLATPLRFMGITSNPLQTIGIAGNITTVGAGMIVGARITIPAVVVAVIAESMVPYLRSIGWLGPEDPYRKIFFIIALGTILGAAIVDMSIIFYGVFKKMLGGKPQGASADEAEAERGPKNLSTKVILGWTLVSGGALAVVASLVMNLPIFYVVIAIGLVFIFVMVNGVSLGVSDSNPISSAFVLTVMLLAAIASYVAGSDYTDAEFQRTFAIIAFMCASIVLIACSVGGDMQQDRSTGWRLGTNRAVQFGYQVVGLVGGAIMCVVFARLFMTAFPELTFDQLDPAFADRPEAEQAAAGRWQAAMTYKFVGAINAIIDPKPHIITALQIGVAIGLVTEVLRKVLHHWKAYKKFVESGKLGFSVGFVIDAFILPTPYASSFGGFVDLWTSLWFGLGGVIGSTMQTLDKRASAKAPKDASVDVPEDMSRTSLIGGGIIAGASLSALCYGIFKLLETVV